MAIFNSYVGHYHGIPNDLTVDRSPLEFHIGFMADGGKCHDINRSCFQRENQRKGGEQVDIHVERTAEDVPIFTGGHRWTCLTSI